MKTFRFMFVVMMSMSFAAFAQADDMGEILSAETRTGSISLPGETDTLSFNAANGQKAIIVMSRQGSSVEPYIRLYCGDNLLAEDSGSIFAELIYDFTQTCACTIVAASGANRSGGYSISLLLIPGPTVSPQDPDGGDILSGESREGSIQFNADTDAYTFEAEANETAIITMNRYVSSIDPYIRLYDDAGNLLAEASSSISAQIIYDFTETCACTIVAAESGRRLGGGYALSLSKIPSTQYSPSIRIILNKNEFYQGDELIVSAHVVNGQKPTKVEVKTWIHLPNGYDFSILNPHYTFTVPSGADFVTQLYSHTFDGSEEAGDYSAGGRFLNPITGREISVNVESFSFSP